MARPASDDDVSGGTKLNYNWFWRDAFDDDDAEIECGTRVYLTAPSGVHYVLDRIVHEAVSPDIKLNAL